MSSSWDTPKPMTIKEFIKELEKFDPELPVYLDHDERAVCATKLTQGCMFHHDDVYQLNEKYLKETDSKKFEQGQFDKILIISEW